MEKWKENVISKITSDYRILKEDIKSYEFIKYPNSNNYMLKVLYENEKLLFVTDITPLEWL